MNGPRLVVVRSLGADDALVEIGEVATRGSASDVVAVIEMLPGVGGQRVQAARRDNVRHRRRVCHDPV